MKALVIQVSDIHLKAGTNVASERLKYVAKAVANVEVDLKAIVLALSGDVAFSGKPEEYAIAKADVEALKLDLEENLRGVDRK